MKQTWYSIGRSVDAHILIAHWGFLDACLNVIFIWDFDMLDYLMIESYCIAQRIDSDFGMIVLITSHAYTHHYISLSLTCWFSNLYTILIVFEHDVCITIHLDCHILTYLVCTWRYIWALPYCMLHDCPPSAWVHVVCLYGRTYIPLPPTLLVSVIPFFSVLTIASVRPSMCLLSDRAGDQE